MADDGAGHRARLGDDEELGDVDERGEAAGLNTNMLLVESFTQGGGVRYGRLLFSDFLFLVGAGDKVLPIKPKTLKR